MKTRPASNACDASSVAARCHGAGIALEPAQAVHLAAYLTLLLQWNRAMNLVGARSWEDALERLVYDSFELAHFLDQAVMPGLPASCGSAFSSHGQQFPSPEEEMLPVTWDLGAGAGLPGIPLRVVWQAGTYWLVEAREKRALFLSTVLARVSLPRTRVFRGRAEIFMQERQADIILSRAFMPWRDVLNLAKEHLRPGGHVVLLLNEPVEAEPGWCLSASHSYTIGNDARYFCALTGLPTNAPN